MPVMDVAARDTVAVIERNAALGWAEADGRAVPNVSTHAFIP